MKFLTGTMFLVSIIMLNGPARADYDDKIWVAQCVRDFASYEVPTPVLYKYCKCMTDEMSDDETQSVKEWEPTHPNEMAACHSKSEGKSPSQSQPSRSDKSRRSEQ